MPAASDSGSKQAGHGASALTAGSPTHEKTKSNRGFLEQLRPIGRPHGTQWGSVELSPGDIAHSHA